MIEQLIEQALMSVHKAFIDAGITAHRKKTEAIISGEADSLDISIGTS